MAAPNEINARATAESAQRNIETISRLEEEAMRRRSPAERVSDLFTRHIGTLTYLVLNVLLFAGWVLVNRGLVPGVEPFDPFPFGMLTLLVTAEGVLLGIFILISQNRMTRQANQRAHLNLQITLLNEQETTKLLQKLQTIADFLGVEKPAGDDLAERLAQDTHVETLAEELQRTLPDD